MRTLIYGLQSSGATLFALFLSQGTDTVGILDYLGNEPAPAAIDGPGDVVCKCTVNAPGPTFADHRAAFRPDRTILFVRDPIQNALRLATKPWRDMGGAFHAKLRLANECLRTWERTFDLLVTYDDFLYRRPTVAAMLGVPPGHYRFCRGVADVHQFNRERCHWCRAHPNQWGYGDIRQDALDMVADDAAALCPDLMAFYAERGRSGRAAARQD